MATASLLKSKALALLANGRRYQEINKPGPRLNCFDCNPFYERGQVGDSGEVTGKDGRVLIKDTFIAPSGQIVHRGTLEAGR